MSQRSKAWRTRSTVKFQRLLARYDCSEGVIAHSLAVAKKALELSNPYSFKVDPELITAGAMLHDIGRSKTHGIEHFLVGAQIAREEGFPEEVIDIIERHIGAGITGEEAEELGLPPGDYIPVTPEEIIVSYSDNITNGTRYLTYPEALLRFKSRLGEDHPAVERFKKQHETIQQWKRRR